MTSESNLNEITASPLKAMKIFEKFNIKIEEIVPDIEVSELQVLGVLELMDLLLGFDDIKEKLGSDKNYLISEWQGKTAFLKRITSASEVHELAVLRSLKELGFPVLFKGVVRYTNNSLYIVNEFQTGKVFRDKEAIRESIDPTQQEAVTQQLERISSLFVENGILARDFQFIVSEEGQVYVIDPEFYMFLGEKTEEQKASSKTGVISRFINLLKRG